MVAAKIHTTTKSLKRRKDRVRTSACNLPPDYFFLRRDLFATVFLRAAAVLLMANSSTLWPCLMSAESHRGRAPRPAHVSPSGPRNFGATLRPFIGLECCPEPHARRGRPPPLLSVPKRDNCCSSSLRF